MSFQDDEATKQLINGIAAWAGRQAWELSGEQIRRTSRSVRFRTPLVLFASLMGAGALAGSLSVAGIFASNPTAPQKTPVYGIASPNMHGMKAPSPSASPTIRQVLYITSSGQFRATYPETPSSGLAPL